MISDVTQTTGQTANPNSGALSSDFDTFLKMLTVQMRNQDPLNPVDAEDFAVQLATFSSVEQQVMTNDLLRSMSEKLIASSFWDYGNFIGKQVKTEGDVQFASSPVDLEFSIPDTTTSAEMVVRAPDGTVIAKQPLDPAQTSVTWAGVASDGTPLSQGNYKVEIQLFEAGQEAGTAEVRSFKTVSEIRNEGGSVSLRLATGETVAASDISAIRG